MKPVYEQVSMKLLIIEVTNSEGRKGDYMVENKFSYNKINLLHNEDKLFIIQG